jgi:hypothetical protein
VYQQQPVPFPVASTFITADNEWQLQEDWRFLLFNQDTYGLGVCHTADKLGFYRRSVRNVSRPREVRGVCVYK